MYAIKGDITENIMWEFSVSQELWRVVQTIPDNPIYDETFDIGNTPGCRSYFYSFAHNSSIFIYGGSANLNSILKGDMWEFDTNILMWRWINTQKNETDFSSTTIDALPLRHGGSFDPGNNPGGLLYSSSVHNNGSFFIFGGRDKTISWYGVNDVWEYNLELELWRLLFHDDNFDVDLYSTDYENNTFPVKRVYGCLFAYEDSLWLFGGDSIEVEWDGVLSDMWEFSLTKRKWRWIDTAGDGVLKKNGDPGHASLTFDQKNYPQPRSGSAYYRLGKSLFIFGGSIQWGNPEYLGGLWEFSIELKQWRWISYESTGIYNGDRRQLENDQTGVYDEKITFQNYPGSRAFPNMVSSGDRFYLMGGVGSTDSIAGDWSLGDLWEIKIPENPIDFVFCNKISAYQIDVCSGNGICLNETCSCQKDYFGTDCEYMSCFGILETDANVCSGNGICSGADSCDCNFMNDDCSKFKVDEEIDIYQWGYLSNRQFEIKVNETHGNLWREIFHELNNPPSRVEAAYFHFNNSVYIFGGSTGIDEYDFSSGEEPYVDYVIHGKDVLGDMWLYDFTLKQWRWINTVGDDTQKAKNFLSEYGVYDTFSSIHYPAARCSMFHFTKGSSFYIYGGTAFRIDEYFFWPEFSIEANVLWGDLWEFDSNIKQWRFLDSSDNMYSTHEEAAGMDLSSFEPSYGSYYDRGHYPSGRFGGVSFTTSDTLIIFGGMSASDTSFNSHVLLADMFQYNITLNQWRSITQHVFQMVYNVPGRYGNTFDDVKRFYPGARMGSAFWQMNERCFIFGGLGLPSLEGETLGSDQFREVVYLNDLWEYRTDLELFRWINTMNDDKHDQKFGNGEGKFGTFYKTESYGYPNNDMNYEFHPRARRGAVLFMKDENSLFLFGGSSRPKYLNYASVPACNVSVDESTWAEQGGPKLYNEFEPVHNLSGIIPNEYLFMTQFRPQTSFFMLKRCSFETLLGDLWELDLLDEKWRSLNREFTDSSLENNPQSDFGKPFVGSYGTKQDEFDSSMYPSGRYSPIPFVHENRLGIIGGYGAADEITTSCLPSNFVPCLNSLSTLNDVWMFQLPKDESLEFECFGIPSLRSNVCNSHGKCKMPNVCFCEEGWSGGSCRIDDSKTKFEYTFVIFSYDDNIESKCDKEKVIDRFCFTEKGYQLSKTIRDHFTSNGIFDNLNYTFEIFIKLHYDQTFNEYYDTVRFSHRQSINDYIHSDMMIIGDNKFSYCLTPSNIDKVFDFKVFQGCYKGDYSFDTFFNFDGPGFSYLITYVISLLVVFSILGIFMFIVSIQYAGRRLMKKQKRSTTQEIQSTETTISKKKKSGWIVIEVVNCLIYLFILKLGDLFWLAFSLSNFITKPNDYSNPLYLQDLNVYNGVFVSLIGIIIIYTVTDMILLMIFLNKFMGNSLMFIVSYVVYKEFVLSKYVLLFCYGIFIMVGIYYLASDYIILLDSIILSDFGFYSLLLSVLMLLGKVLSSFNYNGASSITYYKELYKFTPQQKVEEEGEEGKKSFPTVPIDLMSLLKDPNFILSQVIDCLQAIFIYTIINNDGKQKESYGSIIEKCKNNSIHSHLYWKYVKKLSDSEIDLLIKFFFKINRQETLTEALLFRRVARIDYFKVLFCGFLDKRYYNNEMDDPKQEKQEELTKKKEEGGYQELKEVISDDNLKEMKEENEIQKEEEKETENEKEKDIEEKKKKQEDIELLETDVKLKSEPENIVKKEETKEGESKEEEKQLLETDSDLVE